MTELKQLKKDVQQLREELAALQDAFITYTDRQATKKQ
jgi:hypothetical protein